MLLRTAVICAIALNEEPYIDEWLRYHIKLGFDHIYIYDNDIAQPLQKLASAYPGRVTVISFPGACKQMAAYAEFIQKFRTKHKWAAFIDVDEFVVLREHDSIHDFLASKCTKGAVALSWLLFGSNGHKHYEQGPILSRFTRRHKDANVHVKVIVELSKVECMQTPHSAKLEVGQTYDCHGSIVQGPFNTKPNSDIACVHHYFTKSEGEFLKKCERGRADTHTHRNAIQEFIEHDSNDVEDTSALDFMMR